MILNETVHSNNVKDRWDRIGCGTHGIVTHLYSTLCLRFLEQGLMWSKVSKDDNNDSKFLMYFFLHLKM